MTKAYDALTAMNDTAALPEGKVLRLGFRSKAVAKNFRLRMFSARKRARAGGGAAAWEKVSTAMEVHADGTATLTLRKNAWRGGGDPTSVEVGDDRQA